MTLSACNQAELLVDLDGISTNSYPLTKSLEVFGNECGNSTKAYISWYTYLQGEPMTLTGLADVDGQMLTVNQLQSFSGAEFLSGNSETTSRGELSLIWDTCRRAWVEYDMSASGFDSGTMNLIQLSILKDTDCAGLPE